MLEMVLPEVRSFVKDDGPDLSAETELVVGGRVVNSLALIELCPRLEDRAATMGLGLPHVWLTLLTTEPLLLGECPRISNAIFHLKINSSNSSGTCSVTMNSLRTSEPSSQKSSS